MIKINPPVVKPYAPATQPIANVGFLIQRVNTPQQSATRAVIVQLFDAAGKHITFDRSQIAVMTPAELAAFDAAPSVVGDTAVQADERRLLPYLQAAFGLTGAIS
jgi:hypothetical protein